MKDVFRVRRMWRPRGELKNRYDVVIVGGGSHGLATAYYLAKNHGVKNVAVLEQSYIGSGASGRNTTIIRSNYRTPEGAAFYGTQRRALRAALRRPRLQPHVLAARSSHARALRPCDEHDAGARRGEPAARHRLARRAPARDRPALPAARSLGRSRRGRSWARSTTRPAGSSATTPSSGASRAAPTAHGVEIHPYTTVTGDHAGERPRHGRRDEPRPHRGGRRRERGRRLVDARLRARRRAAPDHDAHPAGVRHRADEAVPRRDHRLGADARVRLPDRPRRVPDRRRDRAVHDVQVDRHASRSSSTPRGTCSSSSRSSNGSSVLRTWTGLCDLSPDYSPILGRTELESFHVSAGWGTYGFKAAPIVGTTLAELVATGKTPDLIAPFALERFHTDTLVSELAAAAVSH